MEGEGQTNEMGVEEHCRAARGLGDCSEECFLGEGGKWLGSVHSSELNAEPLSASAYHSSPRC